MSVLAALLATRQARSLLALLLLYGLWKLALVLLAPGKIDPAVPRARPRVDVVAVLRFPPERFHIEQLQKFGRVSGARDARVEVRAVRAGDLERLARPFWVVRIEPFRDQGG
ncbi:MAG: hypothetical protein N2038_06355 [Geminicoccaceae bacterium]|nr:hypothetical protein [Geminicoccaceae bacterium]MCS7267974.1 hypothetical protein [Geminicoccaceae bacterium]MCX7629855.1 hypothetical protein [Geminicoccaceae bacterium]MDW8124112.1 hypothetical protein [Geminicoccaceae bacterium]MDW8340225.1 hypothetical protein [Geminicoccaceae bacterium]